MAGARRLVEITALRGCVGLVRAIIAVLLVGVGTLGAATTAAGNLIDRGGVPSLVEAVDLQVSDERLTPCSGTALTLSDYDASVNLACVDARPDGYGSATNAVRAVCSFSAETRVLMENGATRPISEIEVGDQVLADNPETGERGPRRVTHLWVHQDTLVDLSIAGVVITTTEDHPFWNHTDGEWQRADALDEGDQVITASGEFLAVNGLVFGSVQRGLAYNLTVDGIRTYYVGIGEEEVLVHNTCGMLGAGGTQVTSRTLMIRPGYRIDVENPAPGVRPGQLHLQDSAGGKYLYDFEARRWTGLPRSLQRQIADDPAVARAIATGSRYLGLVP